MDWYLAQPRYREEDFDLASSDRKDFIDSAWEASPFLRSEWEDGEEKEELKDWTERELGLVCKIWFFFKK